jgi:hypothetical protein
VLNVLVAAKYESEEKAYVAAMTLTFDIPSKPGVDAKSFLQNQLEFENLTKGYLTQLKSDWAKGDRVSALKTGIKCSKLLTSSTSGWFYPSKFALVLDILELLGDFVFDRLRDLGLKNPKQSKIDFLNSQFMVKEKFLPHEVSEVAKETCKNWIYKLSCIRELIPRIYVELVLMRLYLFLDPESIPATFSRIARTIRGIGDPIVASYSRSFLATQVRKLSDLLGMKIIDPVMLCIEDSMMLVKIVGDNGFPRNLAVAVSSISQMFEIISPALSWMHLFVVNNADDNFLASFISRYREISKHALFLSNIMETFPTHFVARHSLKFIELIVECSLEHFQPV